MSGALDANRIEADCQVCGRPCPIWFADDDLWNAVMGNGIVCPTCFILRAEELGLAPRVWSVGSGERRSALAAAWDKGYREGYLYPDDPAHEKNPYA